MIEYILIPYEINSFQEAQLTNNQCASQNSIIYREEEEIIYYYTPIGKNYGIITESEKDSFSTNWLKDWSTDHEF